MDTLLQFLRGWLPALIVTMPVTLFFTWIFSLSMAQTPVMGFTRPWEVPASHPLLEIKKGVVHYLGGSKYPLPSKFGWFGAYLFLMIFPAISATNTIQRMGLSFGWQVAIPGFIGAALAFPIARIFRRLQPRWLNAHLATLPPDATPAAADDPVYAMYPNPRKPDTARR